MMPQASSLLRVLSLILVPALVLPVGCERAGEPNDFSFDFEKYTLANGLDVVLHEDRSDPIVSITVDYHVGGSRVAPGKSGLPHFVEHMMFGPSQNAGPDGRGQIYLAGGSSGGGTSIDVTSYQTLVPNNALELVLWLEADRMGFLEPETTQGSFLREKNLISNEVRQMRNRPYSFEGGILNTLLYPEDHPYRRTGNSLRDISQFTVEDVLDFHRRWYGPNNATLLVAGDFDVAQTKEWIEKYFGEIESGPPVEDLKPQPATLDSVRSAYREDPLAPAPRLSLSFPTVEEYHPDWHALRSLAEFLASERRGPLYQVIVEEQGLAPSVTSSQNRLELAGAFNISARAFPDVDLDRVRSAIEEGLRRFGAESLTSEDVERIWTGIETRFFDYYSGLAGKSEQLAEYNAQTGSPAFVTEQMAKQMAVTKEDILRVFEKYVKDKPYVMVSTVPEGEVDLAVGGSKLATVDDEPVGPPAQAAEQISEDVVVEPIPSSFDRTLQPPIGPYPRVRLPLVWKDTLSNGLRILGIENHETPMVRFSLTMRGGQRLDEVDKVGVANLLAQLMMQGTRSKSATELRDALEALGVNLSVSAGRESITIGGTCLASRLEGVTSLLKEILLEPRWDEAAFLRLKQQIIDSVNQEKSNPPAVAQRVFDRLVYGEDHVFGKPTTGTAETLGIITLDDVEAYHDGNVSPTVTYLTIVGDVSQERAMETFRILEEGWERKDVVFPEYPPPSTPEKPMVFFVDLPGSRQSVIRLGSPAMPAPDSEYYSATFTNRILNGAFRDALAYERGYAYPAGVGSTLTAQLQSGTFEAFAQVQSDRTLESFRVIRDVMDQWRNDPPLEIFEAQKDILVKSGAVNFEQPGSKLSLLNDIALYGLPDDYVQQREDFVRNLTREEFRELVRARVDPDRMTYVVVGDAASQLDSLRHLGLGEPVLVTMGDG